MTRCTVRALLLLLGCVALAADAANTSGDIWADYNHVPTPCDSATCVSGGCLFENCERPLSCTGGLCYFRRCKEAVCEGGACVFDDTAAGKCPGGACQFQNMQATLTEGYCNGGGCKLNGEAHPTSFAAVLSE